MRWASDCLALWLRFNESLPESDGAVEPSFRTRTDTRTKAMTEVPEPMKLYFPSTLA